MSPFEDEHIAGERHYKLRAECLNDVLLLIDKMPNNVWGMRIEQWGTMPDVEFEFKSRLTLDEILAVLSNQVDSHVMMDTLRPLEEYTGDRSNHWS